MRTLGVYLLFAATALRGIVRFWDGSGRIGLVALLAVYGLLMAVPPRTPGDAVRTRGRTLLAAGWLMAQVMCIMGLFTLGTGADFFALLFVPLSLQAVMLFGGRAGALWIAFFGACMLVGLRGVEREPLFGLSMTAVYGGLCFLFGGYAHQVQRAEAARLENQRLLSELQVVHTDLQRYAHQMDDLAAEQERSRLARELHDSVTQTAFSMNLAVQSGRLLLAHDIPMAARQLEKVEELAADAIGEIQALALELNASASAPQDLAAALGKLSAERQRRDGLAVTLQVTGEQRFPEQVVRNLCLITQEALTNVVKHAGACEATLRLSLLPDCSVLEIEDTGRGFEPAGQRRAGGHLGLAAMQERAREIGWELSVRSQPGRGTLIRVSRGSLEGPA